MSRVKDEAGGLCFIAPVAGVGNRMLRILLHGFAAAFLFCLAAPPGDAAAQDGAGSGYVAGIPDLPLMPGLKELPDSGLVFDKPGGRIVEAFARGDVTAQAVIAFYDEIGRAACRGRVWQCV